MSRQTALRAPKQLAELYGIQTVYRDVHGQRRPATREGLLGALRALGVTIGDAGQARDARRQRRRAGWQRLVDPVTVAWLGAPNVVRLQLNDATREAVHCEPRLESGAIKRWSTTAGRVCTQGRAILDGAAYVCKCLPLP